MNHKKRIIPKEISRKNGIIPPLKSQTLTCIPWPWDGRRYPFMLQGVYFSGSTVIQPATGADHACSRLRFKGWGDKSTLPFRSYCFWLKGSNFRRFSIFYNISITKTTHALLKNQTPSLRNFGQTLVFF